MTSQLRYVPLTDIKEGDRFRKDYGDIEGLVQAIQEKGILQPITLDTDMNLQAGGRRLRAAQLLKLKTIPALIRQSDNELDLREVELMENLQRRDLGWQEKANLTLAIDKLYKEKHGEAWSGRKTAAVMGNAVGGVSMDIQLANAMKVVPALANCKTADDARKLIKKATEKVQVNKAVAEQKTRTAHMPVLDYAGSNYRLGDAFEGMETLIREYEEEGRASNIKLFEVDPPYAIDLHSVKRGDEADSNYKEVNTDKYRAWLEKLCDLTFKLAAPRAFQIFWFGPTWFTETKDAIQNAGWLIDDIPCIWNKGDGQTNAPQYYLARSYEPFFLARKGTPSLAKQGRSNVFDFKPVPPSQKRHPTQRPLALMEAVLSTVSHPGTVCCSPFLGSGTTLAACYKQQMHAFGWDLSQDYRNRFLVEIDRMEKNEEL